MFTRTYCYTCIYVGVIPCPYDGDYRCPRSGVCIRSYQVCDGITQCRYGEDEENCSMCHTMWYRFNAMLCL